MAQRLYLNELDQLDHGDSNDRAAAYGWGEAASVLYSMAFLTRGQRAAVRILIEAYQDRCNGECESVADMLSDISSIASDVAGEWRDAAKTKR